MANTMNRRKFVAGMAVAPFAAQAWAKQAMGRSEWTLFVGTQTTPGTSKGIYTYTWNAVKGELSGQTLAAEVDMPTFLALAPNKRHLYAANERPEHGGVTAFAIDGSKLRKINEVPALGSGTCFVSTDNMDEDVFCANYNSGSMSSFKIKADGGLEGPVSHEQYHGHGVNPKRQEGPHAHRAIPSPDNKHVLVNDLGLDCIHIYNLDAATAKLTPHEPAKWESTPGSGPRALQFHPNGKWAYLVCEMESSLSTLHWNAAKGMFTRVQKLSLKPKNYNGPISTGCDVILTRDGRWAYAANRGYNRLSGYRINQMNGTLTEVNDIDSGGIIPRFIALDPTERFILAANQVSSNIAVFPRNAKTGKLGAKGKSYPIDRPQCLRFV
ncbi:MAG TPA: lactonase family protein [Acidobacteriaceae bacterium]|nr:lactonase family protein [Acidobacteriaceae bacterium]